jgi:hypothetical protein
MVFLRMIALPNLLSELRVLQPASFEAGIFQRFHRNFSGLAKSRRADLRSTGILYPEKCEELSMRFLQL